MLPVTLDHEKLIKALDKNYPKLQVRSPKSPDFKLAEREMFFKLGERAVIDSLMDQITNLKKKGDQV